MPNMRVREDGRSLVRKQSTVEVQAAGLPTVPWQLGSQTSIHSDSGSPTLEEDVACW